MYYDDGYKEEFVSVEKSEIPEGYARVYRLGNGDIIMFHDLLLEFNDSTFHEVKEPVGLINPYHERTGRTFTMEQLNEIHASKQQN